ncbi:MAG: hypothetical protein LBU23_03070 [Planctomycetota bacterium]|jgi:hypothetical protein|nr:hypothetical protein [Planctomycetota bacterium]
MSMLVQFVGSAAILAAFAMVQIGTLNPKSLAYLLVNAIGSGLLAADAIIEQQWGFLLLEGSWAVISVIGIMRETLMLKRKQSSLKSGKNLEKFA